MGSGLLYVISYHFLTFSDLQYEMSERKVSVAKSESADSGVGADNIENQDDHEECSEIEQRRVIKPDDVAVRELLNFDEVYCD